MQVGYFCLIYCYSVVKNISKNEGNNNIVLVQNVVYIFYLNNCKHCKVFQLLSCTFIVLIIRHLDLLQKHLLGKDLYQKHLMFLMGPHVATQLTVPAILGRLEVQL